MHRSLKTKTLHRSTIKQLPYPGHAVDRETVAELSMSLTHEDIRVKEAASLSMSTLLINTENVESFYRTGSVSSIIRSLKSTELSAASMKHISMSVASLNILIESDTRLRQELLSSAYSIEVLFKLCQFLVHRDPHLQLNCFNIIQCLSAMDNSIQDFARANIVSFLVSAELLVHPSTHKRVTRGAADLVYKLLLFDTNLIRVKDIEDVCFDQIESGSTTFHDDITENTVFHAVNYALSVNPQPAKRVLVYCLFSLRAERILDTTHLLLLLRCIHGAVEMDKAHCRQALDHGVLHCLLYASNHAYWRTWLAKQTSKNNKSVARSEAMLQMKGSLFERPDAFPELNEIITLQYLYPRLMEILDEVVAIYVQICVRCPQSITSVCSGGIIDSLLSNPKHMSPVNSKEYPTYCVVSLVSRILVVALMCQPSDTHKFAPFLQFMLLSTAESILGPVNGDPLFKEDEPLQGRVDLRMITGILEAQGAIELLMSALQSYKYDEAFDEVISAVAVLYPHLQRGVVTDSIVIYLSSIAMQSRKVFLPSVAIMIMVV